MKNVPLRRRVRAQAFAALARAVDALPEGVARAGLAGAASLARFGAAERTTLANLELVWKDELDERARRELARDVRRHAANQLHEWSHLYAGPRRRAWFERSLRVSPSIEILEREAARGRGVVALAGHVGNWELMAIALRQRGHEGAVIGRRRRNDPGARFLVDMRARWGLESIAQDTSPRVPLRQLERGGVLGVLADLEVRRLAGRFVPFLGVPALTMLAPVSLARASGAPIVPMRCVRPAGAPADEPYELRVEEPLEADAGLDRDAAELQLLERINRVYERWIRETPEQWAWHQKRWRTRPGEREILPWPAHRASHGPPRTTHSVES